MVEDGLFALADGAADDVVKAAVGKQPSPVVPVGFLRGVLDARGIDPDRAAWVAARAQKLLSDWPDDPSARRLIADALYRRSELSDPPWAPDPGRAAVRGYQALPAADHADPAVAAPLAALSLRVLKDPAAALRAAAPLRDPNHAPLLNPAQLEILGAVLTANGHAGEAVEVLERAVRTPRAPAGCWTQLALAYHAERRTAEARQAIERALNQPRSDREQAEWAAAKLLIYRE